MHINKQADNLKGCASKAQRFKCQSVSNKAKKKTDTETMTTELKWFENEKDKRFSFFADPQERKAESRHTFGTLPFARHTSQRFAKVKEPNFPTHELE